MGNRVHVAKAYKVEYADTEAFNWKHTDFFDLLQTLGAEPNWMNGDSDAPDWQFECTKEDYHDAVENLQMHIESPEVYDKETQEDYLRVISHLEEEPKEVLRLMKEFERLAATDDGYIHFAAF